ncbi:hypothetical protein NC652_008365 [Populus alba x Populus x berolinensis]|nr:hypothetical protein NC652_008365 [Populus alba x Populus x berolinensis]
MLLMVNLAWHLSHVGVVAEKHKSQIETRCCGIREICCIEARC